MGNPPSVTYPSPNEWPNTIRTITGISRQNQANVTSVDHGFNASDVGVTSVMFQQVAGMIQINALPGLIQDVPDADHFVVNINSSQFTAYSSGGIANIMTGIPPTQRQGAQTFNTPFENLFP